MANSTNNQNEGTTGTAGTSTTPAAVPAAGGVPTTVTINTEVTSIPVSSPGLTAVASTGAYVFYLPYLVHWCTVCHCTYHVFFLR